MESDTAMAEAAVEVEPTLEELTQAATEARRVEGQMAASVQEARAYLGERQRAWQAAQERSRAAFRALGDHIDERAGVDSRAAGLAW